MGQVRIRRLDEGDLEALARLYRQFWGEESVLDRMRAKLQELDGNPRYAILCATIDGLVVGSIMGIVCEELYGDCRPFLVMENLVVDAQFRRKGIGKALLRELESFARERNCSQILFITEADRREAVAFYASLGFDPGEHVGFKRSLE